MKVEKPSLPYLLKGKKKKKKKILKAGKLQSFFCTFKIVLEKKKVSLYFCLLSMQMRDDVHLLGRKLVKVNEAAHMVKRKDQE